MKKAPILLAYGALFAVLLFGRAIYGPLEIILSHIELDEIGDPAPPVADKLRLYVKDLDGTTTLFGLRSAGAAFEIGAGGAGVYREFAWCGQRYDGTAKWVGDIGLPTNTTGGIEKPDTASSSNSPWGQCGLSLPNRAAGGDFVAGIATMQVPAGATSAVIGLEYAGNADGSAGEEVAVRLDWVCLANTGVNAYTLGSPSFTTLTTVVDMSGFVGSGTMLRTEWNLDLSGCPAGQRLWTRMGRDNGPETDDYASNLLAFRTTIAVQ